MVTRNTPQTYPLPQPQAQPGSMPFAEIDSSLLSMGTLVREINLRKRPNAILRKLMSALEGQRMEKKLGWSRPWNKYGLNIFRSHVHDAEQDAGIFDGLFAFLAAVPEIPSPYRAFADSLRADPGLMAFTFYHNHRLGGARFEGLTLSLGRKAPSDKTKRDRLDLILEDRCCDGKVDGRADKVRLYLNPWDQYSEGRLLTREWEGAEISEGAHALYAACLAKYQDWKEEPARQWEHWSVRYIDYFGPRTFLPAGTAFT
jgi:hypothetical protein